MDTTSRSSGWKVCLPMRLPNGKQGRNQRLDRQLWQQLRLENDHAILTMSYRKPTCKRHWLSIKCSCQLAIIQPPRCSSRRSPQVVLLLSHPVFHNQGDFQVRIWGDADEPQISTRLPTRIPYASTYATTGRSSTRLSCVTSFRLERDALTDGADYLPDSVRHSSLALHRRFSPLRIPLYLPALAHLRKTAQCLHLRIPQTFDHPHLSLLRVQL